MRRESGCLWALALLLLAIPAAAAPARLLVSTYLGGNSSDSAYAVTTDARGNTYVTGSAQSADFPFSRPLQPLRGKNAFVTRLDADGRLVWSTPLGGSTGELGTGIAVGPNGDVFVTGITASADFPRIATSLPAPPAGREEYGDVFVARIDASGSFIRWSTTFGGSGPDEAWALAVDRAGSVYITGRTASPDFPVHAALQPATSDEDDAFLVKLTRDGALVYATYLGGGDFDAGWGVAADAAGHAYVVGETFSADFPTANAAQPSPGGGGDAFVARFSPSGSSLVWSTWLGGSSQEIGQSIALDPAGSAYVTGFTDSPDFPTRNALQPASHAADAFITKLGRSGAVVYSTYLGGSHFDTGTAIAVDARGSAYVAGVTLSTDFPVRDAFQAECQPVLDDRCLYLDAFVAQLAPAGDALVWASYLGGSAGPFPFDALEGIAVDPRGHLSLAGSTFSTDFPTVNAIQPSFGGGDLSDAFVVRITPPKRSRGRLP